MSDENRYIMERKMQEKTIGNYLEKPTVLLKRNFIRDTTFTQEQLNAGSKYDRIEAGSASRLTKAAGVALKKKMEAAYMPNPNDLKIIEGYHNFLANSAGTFINLKVDQNGSA